MWTVFKVGRKQKETEWFISEIKTIRLSWVRKGHETAYCCWESQMTLHQRRKSLQNKPDWEGEGRNLKYILRYL